MPVTFRECWYLTGPTASGKTAVGLELAERIGAEIVSLDSMAVYRGMDIGTAKPSQAERRRVPHHLIDLIEPDSPFSVAQYIEVAAQAVRQIRNRGRQVLFVGGTPLYLKSLLQGIFAGPEADWRIRHQLLQRAKTAGPAALHADLVRVDPLTAARLHANDVRRVVRALEVYQLTGQPISRLRAQFEEDASAPWVFVLCWPREKLYKRIDQRVEQMFAAGLVDEVRRLAQQGPLSRTALQAVGYQEVLDHLAGRRLLDQTMALVKTRTRQFAKRQMTWFRGLSQCRFVDVDEPFDAAQIAQRIVRMAPVG
jgi:tRNA dimethylallyltransferase